MSIVFLLVKWRLIKCKTVFIRPNLLVSSNHIFSNEIVLLNNTALINCHKQWLPTLHPSTNLIKYLYSSFISFAVWNKQRANLHIKPKVICLTTINQTGLYSALLGWWTVTPSKHRGLLRGQSKKTPTGHTVSCWLVGFNKEK